MRLINLYPDATDTCPVLEVEGRLLNKPMQPVMGLTPGGREKHLGFAGDGCTLCNRSKRREKDTITKPALFKGKVPGKGRLLLVFSYLSYGSAVTGTVDRVRSLGYEGDILVDVPVRCGAGDVTDTQLAACRPYLRTTIEKFDPDRIFMLGSSASKSILGMAVPSWSNRWCWTVFPGKRRVPIISFFDPMKAIGSKVHESIFSAELKWGLTADFPVEKPEAYAVTIETEEDAVFATQWFQAMREGAGWGAYDVETDGVMWTPEFNILSCSVSAPGLPHTLLWDKEAIKNPAVFKPLRDYLESEELRKRGANEKYDSLSWLSYMGIKVRGVDGDCRLESKQTNADSSASLENMGFYVGINVHKAEAKHYLKEAKVLAALDYKKAGSPEGVSVLAFAYKYLPKEILLRYNALDTVGTVKVCEYSRAALGPLERTLHRLILPASELFKRVESKGMLIDVGNIEIAQDYLNTEIAKLSDTFVRNDIDPDKPASIRAWLERMGIESPITTATGLASTSSKALNQLQKTRLIKDHNALLANLVQHRKLAKLLSSYAYNLPGYIRADGRVHPSFLIDGARSGRISCTHPALQTIPSKGDLAKLIKNCFQARPGYVLVALDYAILEIRVAAILSGDEYMALAAQTDFHTETAKSIAQLAWGMSPEEVAAEIKSGVKTKRDAGKTLSFAILYGAGPDSVAERVGCSVEAAKRLISAFLTRYARLRSWMKEQEVFAKQHGYIEIPWLDGTIGRIRPLLDVLSMDKGASGNALRAAVNSPIQSVASDICMASAIKIDQWYQEENLPANIVCLVHDSIISEVREDLAQEIINRKAKIMCGWPTGNVPLMVEAEKGRTWGTMEKVEIYAG
jgi:DNA polymerase-1